MVLKENIEKILSKKIKEKVPSHPNIQTKFIVICTDNQNNILKTSLVKERKEICKILLLYNLRRLFIFITKKKMNLLKYCLNKIESKNLLIKNITTNNIPKIINNYNRDNSNIYFIVESTTNISEKVKYYT